MKKLLWFLTGIAGGFVVAHLMNKDPRGHELLADVDARIAEFTDRMADAYHSQEAKLSEFIVATTDAATSAPAQTADAASDLIATTAHVTPDSAAKTAD